MNVSMPRRTSPSELGDYLFNKGVLHDCSVSVSDHRDGKISLKIQDVNAAFKGLLEYGGSTACLIVLEGFGERDATIDEDVREVFEAVTEKIRKERLLERCL